MRVTTLETIPGRFIDDTVGVVRATIMWSRGLKKFSRGGIRSMEYMTTADISDGLNKAREEVEAAMIKQAQDKGADAIIGMRFEIMEMGSGMFSASGMGTAVKSSQLPHQAPAQIQDNVALPHFAAAANDGAVVLPFRRLRSAATN
jgi:uncharacterized protein YbjQ (UPF0145 family)